MQRRKEPFGIFTGCTQGKPCLKNRVRERGITVTPARAGWKTSPWELQAVLSLTQKAGETIVLVDDCGREVRFVTQRVHGNRVTYGIEATTQYKIRREKPRHDSPADLRQRVEELQRQVNRLQRQKVGSN